MNNNSLSNRDSILLIDLLDQVETLIKRHTLPRKNNISLSLAEIWSFRQNESVVLAIKSHFYFILIFMHTYSIKTYLNDMKSLAKTGCLYLRTNVCCSILAYMIYKINDIWCYPFATVLFNESKNYTSTNKHHFRKASHQITPDNTIVNHCY